MHTGHLVGPSSRKRETTHGHVGRVPASRPSAELSYQRGRPCERRRVRPQDGCLTLVTLRGSTTAFLPPIKRQQKRRCTNSPRVMQPTPLYIYIYHMPRPPSRQLDNLPASRPRRNNAVLGAAKMSRGSHGRAGASQPRPSSFVPSVFVADSLGSAPFGEPCPAQPAEGMRAGKHHGIQQHIRTDCTGGIAKRLHDILGGTPTTISRTLPRIRLRSTAAAVNGILAGNVGHGS